MNGGADNTIGSCYGYFTGYHAQRSQNWAIESTQILSSDVSSVPSDGLYLYNSDTKSLVPTNPDAQFTASVETGVPVVTFVSRTLTLPADSHFH
jgi:hypothetical protein